MAAVCCSQLMATQKIIHVWDNNWKIKCRHSEAWRRQNAGSHCKRKASLRGKSNAQKNWSPIMMKLKPAQTPRKTRQNHCRNPSSSPATPVNNDMVFSLRFSGTWKMHSGPNKTPDITKNLGFQHCLDRTGWLAPKSLHLDEVWSSLTASLAQVRIFQNDSKIIISTPGWTTEPFTRAWVEESPWAGQLGMLLDLFDVGVPVANLICQILTKFHLAWACFTPKTIWGKGPNSTFRHFRFCAAATGSKDTSIYNGSNPLI